MNKKIRVLNSGGAYCEIFIDDELSYKINQKQAGSINFTDSADNLIAEVKAYYGLLVRKNVLEAFFNEDNKYCYTDRNLWGTRYIIRNEKSGDIEIRYNEWAGKLYLFNQAVAINRTGGFFDKFTNEVVFNLDDAANAAMVMLTVFHILCRNTGR